MLKSIRVILAVISILAVTVLFVDVTGCAMQWLGWIAKIQFMPAVLALNVGVIVFLVVLALLLGRVYCSVICPLGIMQDVISWIHGKAGGSRRFRFSQAKTWLRILVLGLFVMAMIAGLVRYAVLVEPYSEFGRIVSSLVKPVYVWFNNFMATHEAEDSYNFYHVDYVVPAALRVTAAVTLVIVGVLAWIGGRTYCNTICPVGTILGYLSQYSWFKPVIDTSKCINCGLCERKCKASCIDAKNHVIDYTRCVACMDCLGNCSKNAISYCHPSRVNTEESTPDAGRRSFLTVGALLGASAALKAQEKLVDGGLADIVDKKRSERKTPLTPPGSRSYANFTQHCVSCQLCITQCPNGVLRPSSDMTTFMLPEMSYERGYCRPECTKCSEVCPAGAIKPIDNADKSAIQIGHAVWRRESCLPATEGVSCGNCARHCPTGAITMISLNPDDKSSPKVPAVDTERCIGCGACENLCPVSPYSAIYVEGHENHRII